MKSIVITGALGFIGSCMVRHLNDLGYTNLILVDDVSKTTKWKNVLGKQFQKIIPIHGLFPYLEGREGEIEAIIHLGACSDTLEADGNYLMENNYRYTIRLAEFALNHGVRFIYASSAATYGDGSKGFKDDHALLDHLEPLNLYGFSKHAFDLWAKQHGVLDQLVGLKYFNVYGPNENEKGRMASMVFKMVPIVQKEGEITLFKSTEPDKYRDGEQVRDFIYVKDAVRMTAQFLKNRAGGIFNIGSGKTTTWKELATAVFDALGEPVKINYIDMPSDMVKQYQNYTMADMKKFSGLPSLSETEKQVAYSTAEGVKDYVQNYILKEARW